MHFNSVFDNPLTMLSIWNTMKVGVITALLGGVLAFAIGYTVNRTNVAGRRSIDLLATLPVAIPGLVVGVAYLWAWIGLPGGLYGTLWILALAFIARFMPDTVKALSTSFTADPQGARGSRLDLRPRHAGHHPHHRAAAGRARRGGVDDAPVRAGDPRARARRSSSTPATPP